MGDMTRKNTVSHHVCQDISRLPGRHFSPLQDTTGSGEGLANSSVPLTVRMDTVRYIPQTFCIYT